MKLFTKTLLFFISVILFQSSLTIFLLANITRKSNHAEAVTQITREAVIVADNYHSWKRGIWKNLTGLQQHEQLTRLLQQNATDAHHAALLRMLKDQLVPSGIDTLVLKFSSHGTTDMLPITYNNFSLSDVQDLRNLRPHPYLEARLLNGQLCLVGVIRFVMQSEAHVLDLFLIKRLDGEFCRQLVLNRTSQAAFFLRDRYISGSRVEEDFPGIPALLQSYNGHTRQIRAEIASAGHNLAIQRIEELAAESESRSVFLVVAVSNAPYIQRVAVLEHTVLSVTAVSAVLTIVLSLFFSKHITRPIHRLLSAMQSVRRGVYHTIADMPSRNEIGALITGFNEMALNLRQDKEQMENYIHEITVLHDYNENIIQSIRAGLLILNPRLQVEKANSVFLSMFQLDEATVFGVEVGSLPLELFDDAFIENIHAILTRRKEEFTKIFRARGNGVYEVKLYPITSSDPRHHSSREVFGCIVVVEDISRKIEFEEKIFQAEKLSSISMLSAGVAHEINNPLGSIMTNVQNLLDEEEDGERAVSLKWIEQETRRIARIIRKLLDFASSDTDSAHGADVNSIIEDTVTLLSYSLRKQQEIAIQTALTPDLPWAAMSQDEFKQIIINLLKNAMQAIDKHGRITIATTHDKQNRRVLVSVEDTGVGIKEELIPRIFDPFFTTKPTGDGTGLGLSIVYGIINKYKGTITVTSQEGQGTQARLSLPAQISPGDQ